MARTPRDLLTPAALHILMALSQEDRHGYAIKKAVAAQTRNRMRLGPGTLYEAIHRMESAGWIEEVESGPSEGRPRRTYRITPTGKSLMEEELDRLSQIVGFAEAHALLPESRKLSMGPGSERWCVYSPPSFRRDSETCGDRSLAEHIEAERREVWHSQGVLQTPRPSMLSTTLNLVVTAIRLQAEPPR